MHYSKFLKMTKLIDDATRRIAYRHPNLFSLLNRVECSYYSWQFDSRHGRFEAPLNPLKIVYVDPDSITRYSSRPVPYSWENKYENIGMITGGEWDQIGTISVEDPLYHELYGLETFEESVFFKSLYARFAENVNWTDTPFIKRLLALDGAIPWTGCETKADVMSRCRYLDSLYRRIDTDGYMTAREREVIKSPPRRLTHEIMVDVTRDGELLLVDGKHRLAFAKILELQTVPIGIVVRHREWMKERDRVWNENNAVLHPDLAELGKFKNWELP